MSDEKSSGQVLSENFRRAAGLPERESDAPITDGGVPSEVTNATGPEGGLGGDPDYTEGDGHSGSRRPSLYEDTELVEGPPNPPEGQAHNMSSGQWREDAEVSPVATDEPVEGVDGQLEAEEKE